MKNTLLDRLLMHFQTTFGTDRRANLISRISPRCEHRGHEGGHRDQQVQDRQPVEQQRRDGHAPLENDILTVIDFVYEITFENAIFLNDLTRLRTPSGNALNFWTTFQACKTCSSRCSPA